MKKTLFIDGLGLVEGHFSGVGQYILGILNGLDEIVDELKYKGERYPDICVFIPWDTAEKFKSFGFKNIRYKRLPLNFRYTANLWHRGKLPPIDLWLGKGYYIFPRFVNMPLAFNSSDLLVIYDLSYELHREFSDEGNALFLSKAVKKCVTSSKKIITISEHAKREIVNFYNLPESKVTVAYPATDPKLFYRRSGKEIEHVKQKYGISDNYILALSNLEPRKNLDSLVDAYCSLPKDITDDLSLLLVGVSGWKTDGLFKKIIEKVNEGYNITRPTTYIKDADKPAIISGAKMLVYPSHYEGFGMPPLEALACGVPVIVADNSSLPEAVGGAGKLVKINNSNDLRDAMLDSLNILDKISSEALIVGPKHAESFSWKSSAQLFLEAIEAEK